MKTVTSLAFISIGSFLLSCDDVEPIPTTPPDPVVVPTKASANFHATDTMWPETASSPVEITVRLSEPVTAPGKVFVSVLSEKMNTFTTNPSLANDGLTLNAAVGDSVLKFTIQPLNDNIVTGHTEVIFSITFAEGSIVKGNQLINVLTIQDDELALKVMGYETTGAGDVVKKTYEYDSKGRISKVHWETHTPNKRFGTETLFYDENDRLVKINKFPGRDVLYSWDAGKIWKADEYSEGTLLKQTIYTYDAQGNISGQVPYYRQLDGTMKLEFFIAYEYFGDGNIHKSRLYTQEGEEDPVLLSTKTYDNYMDVNNPFPMVEILPGVKSQHQLATSYRVEENGFDFQYSISYEFRDDGLPEKSIATAAGVSETTIYKYY